MLYHFEGRVFVRKYLYKYYINKLFTTTCCGMLGHRNMLPSNPHRVLSADLQTLITLIFNSKFAAANEVWRAQRKGASMSTQLRTSSTPSSSTLSWRARWWSSCIDSYWQWWPPLLGSSVMVWGKLTREQVVRLNLSREATKGLVFCFRFKWNGTKPFCT
jgi:hypothetical protein